MSIFSPLSQINMENTKSKNQGRHMRKKIAAAKHFNIFSFHMLPLPWRVSNSCRRKHEARAMYEGPRSLIDQGQFCKNQYL
jgi:hypothetical protein